MPKMFPLFVNLSQKKFHVFGAGVIATRRVQSLLSFVNEICVFAPEISEELEELGKQGKIRIVRESYGNTMLTGADFVLAATDNIEVNEEIYEDCKELGIMVNVSSDKSKCDFFFPGIVEKEGIVIGVTAGGSNHKQAKEITTKIRNEVESWI